MNKIEGPIVSALLIAIFMGTVSVEGLVPSSPSPTPTLASKQCRHQCPERWLWSDFPTGNW